MLPTYAIDNKIIEILNWSFESCIPFIELAVTSSLKTSVTDIFGEFIFYLIFAEATPQWLLLHFSCINLTITCMSHALCFDLCWFEDDVSTFCGWKRKRKERKIFILNANVLVFLFLIHSLCFIIYLCMKICFLMCLLFHVHTLCSYRWMMMYICLEDLIKANSCECITLSNIFFIYFSKPLFEGIKQMESWEYSFFFFAVVWKWKEMLENLWFFLFFLFALWKLLRAWDLRIIENDLV